MFGASPVALNVAPLLLHDPLGEPFKVHVPGVGNPEIATVPVGVAHVGWVIVPMIGALGNGKTLTVTVPGVPSQPPDEVGVTW